MNRFLSSLYKEGFWIASCKATQLVKLFFLFLKSFQLAAVESSRRHMNRFAFVPKVHMLHHGAHQLHQEAVMAHWAMNPLATSVQIQEDFIGRPARLSRRVAMRSIHMRVLQRTLISAEFALRLADRDQRF